MGSEGCERARGADRLAWVGGADWRKWLYAAMRDAGLAVELLETRHVRNAFKIMPVKTDRKDAQGIAELMRLGWFRPVHCISGSTRDTRDADCNGLPFSVATCSLSRPPTLEGCSLTKPRSGAR
jgi:hypothetical protein